ncbi:MULTISPECIES: hypothetical protein [unclassified Providencia]|uniref:hypothetical protein n=2 Tax=Providencia TaxID=586 RepID=UPI00234A3C80|nr:MULTISPECIES: hypothetical protein [unclassified Providencia]
MKSKTIKVLNTVTNGLEHTANTLNSFTEKQKKINISIAEYQLQREHNRPIEYEIAQIKAKISANDKMKLYQAEYKKLLIEQDIIAKEIDSMDEPTKEIYLKLINTSFRENVAQSIQDKQLNKFDDILTDAEINELENKVVVLEKLLRK